MRLSSASAHPVARAGAAESASANRAARETRSRRQRIAPGLYGSPASEDLQEGEVQDDAVLAAVPARDRRAGVEPNERRPWTGDLPGKAGAAEIGPVQPGRGIPHARVLVEGLDAKGVSEDVAVRELRHDGLLGPERAGAESFEGSSAEETEGVVRKAIRLVRAWVLKRGGNPCEVRKVKVLRELQAIRPVFVLAGVVVRIPRKPPRVPLRALVPRVPAGEGPALEVPGELSFEARDPVVGGDHECGRRVRVGGEVAMRLPDGRRELHLAPERNPRLEVGCERARLDALAPVLGAVHVERVGSAERDAEDVDAGVECRSEEARLVVRGGEKDSREEDLQLLVPVAEIEVDVVEPEKREGIVVRAVVEETPQAEQLAGLRVLGDDASAVRRLLEITHAFFRVAHHDVRRCKSRLARGREKGVRY